MVWHSFVTLPENTQPLTSTMAESFHPVGNHIAA